MSFSGRPPWWQALHKTGLLVTLAGAALLAGTAQARSFSPDGAASDGFSSSSRANSLDSASVTVPLAALPTAAQDVYRLILAGGPFPPRSKDGVVFGNRERLLPRAPRGYYREYTVPTAHAGNRGARRIVCGGTPPTNPEACFYTDDHYASFRQIVQ